MTASKRLLCCALLLVATAMCGDDNDRKTRERPEPEYPAIAKQMNLHGIVKLKLWVSADGAVQRVEYLGGHPLLADSAIKTVKLWKFEKAANETTAMVEVKF